MSVNGDVEHSKVLKEAENASEMMLFGGRLQQT
jgi:hypothetical protein